MEELVRIGEAARRLGLNASALRYYEKRGLIHPTAPRDTTRMYGPGQSWRLAFIQAGQRLVMTLDDIAAFLDGPPAPVARHRPLPDRQPGSTDPPRRISPRLPHTRPAMPSEHPVDQCPHLRGILDQQLGLLDN
jgi:MerR family copper efflux transcriptional regulator